MEPKDKRKGERKMFDFINYNGETITKCGSGYSVYFEGDGIYFNSLDEAINFINEVSGNVEN